MSAKKRGNLVVPVRDHAQVHIGRDVTVTVLVEVVPDTRRRKLYLRIEAPPTVEISRAQHTTFEEHMELQVARERGITITREEARRRASSRERVA